MLSSALSSGVLLGLATMMSGPLFDEYGTGGYAAMAVLAGLGVAAAMTMRRLAVLQPQSAGEGGRTMEPS